MELEYSKSNRAACKQCKEKIEKGVVRIGLKTSTEKEEEEPAFDAVKWHHFQCLPRMRGVPWFKKNFTGTAQESFNGIADLKEEEQKAVEALFLACRGEGPMPEAPAGPEAPAAEAKGKRKKKGGEEEEPPAKAAKAAVLSPEQLAAIEKAKEEFTKKNAAALNALLTKNGLPKVGRKDELVERCAENKALGVPPTCVTCEKVKLKFSRARGQFSCPGFFDSEVGAFKRCKGPAADVEVKREPWQNLSA